MRRIPCDGNESEIQIAIQHTFKHIWMTTPEIAADWKLPTELDVDHTKHKRRYI
jgi:hypothetical protein